MLALGSRKYWTSNLKHFPYTLRSELETNRPLDSYDRFFLELLAFIRGAISL